MFTGSDLQCWALVSTISTVEDECHVRLSCETLLLQLQPLLLRPSCGSADAATLIQSLAYSQDWLELSTLQCNLQTPLKTLSELVCDSAEPRDGKCGADSGSEASGHRFQHFRRASCWQGGSVCACRGAGGSGVRHHGLEVGDVENDLKFAVSKKHDMCICHSSLGAISNSHAVLMLHHATISGLSHHISEEFTQCARRIRNSCFTCRVCRHTAPRLSSSSTSWRSRIWTRMMDLQLIIWHVDVWQNSWNPLAGYFRAFS